MISKKDFEIVNSLDLEPIKVKLMHKKSGEGWSFERASAVEREYRRFLYLMKKFPNEPTSPLIDVDTFWHYHILDTTKYAADCQRVFGYFLHHFPYVGMRGDEDEKALQRMGERMRVLYEQTFGEDYLRRVAVVAVPGTSRSSGVNLRTAYGGTKRPAADNCRVSLAERAQCAETAETAWCTFATAEPAWCTRATAEPAWCTFTISASAAAGVTSAQPAWCGAPPDEPLAPADNGHASRERITEERVGFYLERPRLPQA